MDEQKPLINRQKFPRIKSVNLTSYETADDKDFESEGLGITQNISLGGLMLEVNKNFPVDTVIAVELALHDKTIKAKGRVMHVQEIDDNKYDLGMKFVEITQQDFNTLWEYLEQKKKEK